ncbi:hypothetical protein J437_LFUL004074 [Ladona fulva]|uniref:E3 ubiquitin-protein ligase n=1 Tax=Ladona fulva TaxID=123851 RepID=A0A8K0JX09_LADFU|nr:hypothetical protein J437_LFUL004074 [Ladona fulva]
MSESAEEEVASVFMLEGGNSGSASSSFSLTTYDGGSNALVPVAPSSGGPTVSQYQPSLPSTIQRPAVLAGIEIVPMSAASASSTPTGTPTGSEMVPVMGQVTHPGSGSGSTSHQVQHNQDRQRGNPGFDQIFDRLLHEVNPGTSVTSIPSRPLITSRSSSVPGRSSTGHSFIALTSGNEIAKGNYNATPSSVEVNESIISLLLKLHSHLSGAPDSYDYDGAEARAGETGRIGDGPYFVGRLLDRICLLDSHCSSAIKETRNKLWSRKNLEEERITKEEDEKEERRRRAKERQKKLMAEFASRQRQFMENAMETEEDGSSAMDWSEDGNLLVSKQEYDCVICGQTSPSTEDRPMGLSVLVQATSVIGHKRKLSEAPILPTNDEEKLNLRQHDSLTCEFDRRVLQLSRHFASSSWLLSVNIGCEGGIHVQTCGHHLHLDCLKSYLHILRIQQRQQNLAADRGEYLCPLCRQSANSVLPLSPQLGECAAVARSWKSSMSCIISELCHLLKENPPTPSQSNLTDAMAKAMEDMTNSTYRKYSQFAHQQASPQSIFLVVSSIARTNLEVEIIQRGGTLCTPANGSSSASTSSTLSTSLIPKRSCLVPLLHVLAVHARLLAHWPAWQTLTRISGVSGSSCSPPIPSSSSRHLNRRQSDSSLLAGETCAVQLPLKIPLPAEGTSSTLAVQPLEESLALSPKERDVPLLLRDPTALLTQFILLLPLQLELRYFTCIVKILYNLLYFQVLAQLSCNMPERRRASWRYTADSGAGLNTLEGTLGIVIDMLEEGGQLYVEEYSDCGTPEEEGEGTSGSDNTKEPFISGSGEAGMSTWPTTSAASSAVPGTRPRPQPSRATSSGSSPNSQKCGTSSSGDEWGKREIELEVQWRCLPFLRVAALLRHHLYGESLPEIRADQEQSEFVRLVYFLELVTEGMPLDRFNAAVALNWACSEESDRREFPGRPEEIISGWCSELSAFAGRGRIAAARCLLEQHIRWQQPRLLRLPNLYDKVFQYYHGKQCGQCHSVPREATVCLLCGTLVCLKEPCCKEQNVCETVRHSIDCGAGTAMYLVVTSSLIMVIRGKRACLWGSVYLDSFGEEDRDLKRGKPLYLSPGRYQLLEQQWLAHRFDHTNKKWVWHHNAL